MDIIYKSPKIEVTGTSKYDILKTWVDSRPAFLRMNKRKVWNIKTGEKWNLDEYYNQVMEGDLAFNYFQTATFKMSTSVMIRDFFYMHQEYKGKWATTQRFDVQKDMVCSTELDQGDLTVKTFEIFKAMTDRYNEKHDIPFDKVREKMPLAYQVHWQCSMPIKQFIKILAHLLLIVGPQCKMWKEIWAECYSSDILRPWLSKITKYMNCEETYRYSIERLPMLYETKTMAQKEYQDIGQIGSVLFSQLIRHEDTWVAGYPEFMKRVLSMTIESEKLPDCCLEFDARLKQSPIRRQEMLKVRTSWFACTDDWSSNNTWAAILRRYIPDGSKLKDMKKYFKCFDANGNFDVKELGKFDFDDSLRLYKGYNAGFPNAFQLESRDIVLQRIKKNGDNPLLQLFLQFFDDGYVKDNPENPYRKQWEELNRS